VISLPTADAFQQEQSATARTAFAGLLALIVVGAATAFIRPTLAIALLILPIGLVVTWLWHAPIRGVYLLVFAAATIEIFPLGFPDSLTDRIPFFLNLDTSHLAPVAITPAEIVMIVVIAIWLAKAISARELHLPAGRLLAPYLAFLLVTIASEIRGIAAGGDFRISLWELRPQVYGFTVFVLVSSLVTERRHISRLTFLALAGISLKAMIGVYRYWITLDRDTGGVYAILGHEDSYFLGLLLVAALIALLWHADRRIMVSLALIAPLAATALLANERRVGIIALIAGIIVVALLAFRALPRQRSRIIVGAAAAAVALAVFIPTYWSHDYGFAAQILRPVKALVGAPSPRDTSSDQYRVAENVDILAAFRSNPLIGIGFGRPMPTVVPLVNISTYYPFWNYIPHNTLLWVAMRMGIVGMVAFWGLVGMALLEGVHQSANLRPRLLSAVAAFATTAIVAELVMAYGDIQLENYRNMIFFGAALGLLNRLPQLSDA
jgi:O-antigen ligase